MAAALQVIGQTNQLTSAIARRPITHADYDGWHTIQSENVSHDGKWVAYALMPQAGDAGLLERHLAGGDEFRAPIGLFPPADSMPGVESPSGFRILAGQTYPTKAQNDHAKKTKKNAEG